MLLIIQHVKVVSEAKIAQPALFLAEQGKKAKLLTTVNRKPNI
jgi:hypothetical protein